MVEALEKMNYITPSKVQEIVIPKALKGENVVVQSETGSGKTHAFLIPLINNLTLDGKLQGIIISPTRELAMQTYNFAIKFKEFYPSINIKLFIGGKDMSDSLVSFNNGAEIIIGTPGRINALLEDTTLDLTTIKTFVLDEADMLIDHTFLKDIDSLLSKIKPQQIEVFSATISKNVESFLKKYIGADYILTTSEKNLTSRSVNHFFINAKHQNLFDLVDKFIKVKNPFFLLVFCNSKKEVNSLYEYLSAKKYKCGLLSGDLSFRERKSMLRRINDHTYQIVVCSDMASRGLDIIDVSDVLSLGLPYNLEYYYHRAGRCGRQFKEGNSYVFYNQDQITLALKLIDSKLINFKYLKFDGDELVEDTPIQRVKRKYSQKETELSKDIKRAKYEAKSDKVKPGYKKKIKRAVEKVKREHRREVIKKDIRRQINERYKKENKE